MEKSKEKDVQSENIQIMSNGLNEQTNAHNNYLLAKKNARKKHSKNKGDLWEVLLQIELFYLNETKQFDKLIAIFGEKASEGIQILNMNTKEEILNILNFDKAKGNFKADCMIKMKKIEQIIYPSIKCKNGGCSSIMNHTRRDAKVFQPGGYLHHLLPDIDRVVKKYHTLRDEMRKEEIEFGKLHNFTDKDNEVLMQLILYFMFRGTGKGDSKIIADSLLIIDGTDFKYYDLNIEEDKMKYIKDNWELFNISLISRKNLSGLKFKDEIEKRCITDKKYKQKIDIMKPWIYETCDNGKNNPEYKLKMKQSLHLRMK